MKFHHRKDIMNHKVLVSQTMKKFIDELYTRQMLHDNDKISDDLIFESYNKHNHTLRLLPFKSEEYSALLNNELSDASQLHAQNRHHFYSKSNQNEYNLTFFDFLEVIADFHASIARDDSLSNTEINFQLKKAMSRTFENISIEELCNNTVDELFKE